MLLLGVAVVGIGASGQTTAHGADLTTPLSQAAGAGDVGAQLTESAQTNALSALQAKPMMIAALAGMDGGTILLAQESTTAEMAPETQAGVQESGNVEEQTNRAQRRRMPKRAGVLGTPEAPVAVIVSPEVPLAQGAEAAVEPGQTQAVPQVTTMPSVAVEPDVAAQEEAEVGTKYRLAPIRWGGSASETFGWRRVRTPETGSATMMDNVQAVSVRAVTYIIQPWLATVRGDVGLVNGTANNAYYFGGETRTHHTNLTGGADVAVLSQSRYPFTMSFRATDSRLNQDNLLSGDYSIRNDWLNKSLSMTQNYSPLSGVSHYSAGYDRSITNYKSLGTDTSSTLNGAYTTSFGSNQPFNLSAYHNAMNSYLWSGTMRQDSITAYHVWLPEDSLLTVRTTAGVTELRLPQIAGFNSRTEKNRMIYSTGSWQPESEDVPLIVTGYARLRSAQTEQSDRLGKTNSVDAGIAAAYDKWKPLMLTVGATVAKTNSSDSSINGLSETSDLATTQYGVAYYRPQAINFAGNWVYNWNADAGFNNQTSTIANAANRYVYADGYHALFAPLPFVWTNITTSLNQGLRVQSDRFSGRSETLTHGALVAWVPQARVVLPSISPAAADPDGAGIYDNNGVQIFKAEARERLPKVDENRLRTGGAAGVFSRVSLDLRDTRVYGEYPSHTESLRVVAGLAGATGYSASGYGAQGDISLEASRQVNGPLTTDAQARVSWAYGYAYHYKTVDILGVRGLRYDLDLDAKAGLFAATGRIGESAYYTQPGVMSRKNPFSLSLVQTLGYRIGQNEARLSGSLVDDYGRKVAALFLQLRAWRNFGN